MFCQRCVGRILACLTGTLVDTSMMKARVRLLLHIS